MTYQRKLRGETDGGAAAAGRKMEPQVIIAWRRRGRVAWEDGCITLARVAVRLKLQNTSTGSRGKKKEEKERRRKKGIGFINTVSGTDSLVRCI